MNDANGDGVEDNQQKTQGELDKFRKKVFGMEMDDMHNTHNGEFPGHVRAGEFPMPKLTNSAAQVESESASAEAAKSLDEGLASSQSNVEINVDNIASKFDPVDQNENDVDSEYLQMGS